MSIFNLLKKNSPNNLQDDRNNPEVENVVDEKIIDRNLFVKENSNNNDNRELEMVSYQKKIFNYLNSDFESKGYHDALTNPDTKYKIDNIKILEYDLILLINEAEMSYIDFLTDIDFHISSRSKSSLDDLVEELESKKDSIIKKLDFVIKIKTEIDTQTGASQRILLSYQRGFTRGLAALTSANIINKNV